jgi:hypothetical protein
VPGSSWLPLRVQGLGVGTAVPNKADLAHGGPAAEGGGGAPRLDAVAQLRAPALLDLLDERRGAEDLVRGLALDHEAHHLAQPAPIADVDALDRRGGGGAARFTSTSISPMDAEAALKVS